VCCKTEIQDSDLCELLAGARKVISGGKGKSQELKASPAETAGQEEIDLVRE
jgi:hypothetical protein